MPTTYQRHCDHCGDYYEGRGKKYCSVECHSAARRTVEDRDCAHCGDTFRPDEESTRYCSHDCANRDSRRLEEQVCKWCGEDFRPAESGQSYCSRPCYLRARRHGDSESQAEDPPALRKVESQQLEDGRREWRLFHGEPHTYEEAREKLEIDEERWEVTKFNRWEQKPDHWCHQITAAPREDVIDVRELVDDALERYRTGSPPPDPVDHSPSTERTYLGLLRLPDHHIRMLAWAPETREVHYDSRIGARLFRGGIVDLSSRIKQLAGGPPSEWLFPVGDDLAHADQIVGDDSGAATARGTVVDVDTRRQKSYRIIREVLEQGILELRETAPVTVPIVAGNHSPDTEFTLGELLDARFHDDPHVEIINNPSGRYYHQHGRVLLGFVHGDDIAKSRLPMLMPIEVPEMWSQTDHREWMMGHTHHLDQRGFAMEVEEDTSIRLRRNPTLCPSDAWHASQGFKRIRAAEAFLYSAEHGFEGLVNCTPQSVEDLGDR